MATKRAQYYTFLLYEDSAVKDWLEILKSFHIPMYLSLHDKDVDIDKATGEITPKKAHWHVLVMFDSLKALDCLDEMIAMVNGVKPPPHEFIVQNKRSMARYLSHLDEDPYEKYPYHLSQDHEVLAIGGAEDYYALCKGAEETRREEMNTTKDIQDFCEKKEIDNVATFLRLCRATEHDEWIEAIKKNSYFWGMWFRAYQNEDYSNKDKVKKIISKSKGEKNNESDN